MMMTNLLKIILFSSFVFNWFALKKWHFEIIRCNNLMIILALWQFSFHLCGLFLKKFLVNYKKDLSLLFTVESLYSIIFFWLLSVAINDFLPQSKTFLSLCRWNPIEETKSVHCTSEHNDLKPTVKEFQLLC